MGPRTLSMSESMLPSSNLSIPPISACFERNVPQRVILEFVIIIMNLNTEGGQTLQGSLPALLKPIFAINNSLEMKNLPWNGDPVRK